MKGPLDHESVLTLLQRVKKGDEAARAELFECNVALVKAVVRRFLNRGAEYDDLVQLGGIGLLKAIDRFDPAFGVRFSTYAVPMIAGEIRRFLRDDGMVKVSRAAKELAAKAAKGREALCVQLGREPTAEELAAHLGVPPEELVFAEESARRCRSLDEPVCEQESAALVERISAEQNTDPTDGIFLKEMLGALEPRERQIIVLRYLKDETQKEVAKKLGVSQVQISRLESRILSKMREKAQ